MSPPATLTAPANPVSEPTPVTGRTVGFGGTGFVGTPTTTVVVAAHVGAAHVRGNSVVHDVATVVALTQPSGSDGYAPTLEGVLRERNEPAMERPLPQKSAPTPFDADEIEHRARAGVLS